MDETRLLKIILPQLAQRSDVAVGPGDDAAVLKFGNDLLLAAVDQVVGNVHFFQDTTSPEAAGAKLLKRNLSDIAAMGGEPLWALTAIAAKNIDSDYLIRFNLGIAECAKTYNTAIVGGDLSSLANPGLAASLTILGRVTPEKLCLRSNAKAGEKLFVTGCLGDSLSSNHHLNFIPRLAEAQFLAGTYTKCMMDISDGVGLDALRLAEASKVRILLNTKHLPPRNQASIKAMLTDGEDYELLFTVAPNLVKQLQQNWPFATKLTCIGEILTAGEPGLADENNLNINEEYYGYQHFKE